jgi:hypothetical protein
MERRINCSTYEIAIMVAPNKAYETFRKSVSLQLDDGEVNPLLPGTQGDIRSIVKALPEPLFEEVADACEGMFQTTRLARYVLEPARWVEDLEKTYDEVALEVATAAFSVGVAHVRPIVMGEALPAITAEMAALAPVARLAARPVAPEVTTGEVTLLAVSNALVARPVAAEEGEAGWTMLKKVYGDTTADIVCDMEDMGTEEQVGEVLNARYSSVAEFEAAIDAFYGEPEAVMTGESNTTAALNT